MKDADNKTDAYREGYSVGFKSGWDGIVRFNNNPYEDGSEENIKWQIGYSDGEDDRYQDLDK